MASHSKPRQAPAPDFAPTTLTEIARRYYACAVALAKAMGVPLSETFLREHRESISCCFIEAGRAGVRLPAGVQLPPLRAAAPVASTNGQPDESNVSANITFAGAPEGEVICSGLPPPPESEDPPRVPPDSGLPCGGQRIKDLKPAALSMLINRAAALVRTEGERWVVLLHAL
jgi:hypothetical protein